MRSLFKFKDKPIPWVTVALILANVIIHILVFSSSNPEAILSTFGEHPTSIIQGEELHTLFTSMFLHANHLHIFGNMLYLSVFGVLVERRLGHKRFLAIYLIAGFIAALVTSWFWTTYLEPTSASFAVGASGAIGGILGACLLGFPRAKIPAPVLILFLWFLTAFFNFRIFLFSSIPFILLIIYTRKIKIPAIALLLIWFVEQFFIALTIIEPAPWAHLGGFMTGALLYYVLKKEKAPFHKEDRGQRKPPVPKPAAF
ncbi:MAG: rhomboid family intramembrane serine protease [Hadesarchaea archaeon]|nr:rhomboid family intramembrane serine protease [Hadesarchaea archaeon]